MTLGDENAAGEPLNADALRLTIRMLISHGVRELKATVNFGLAVGMSTSPEARAQFGGGWGRELIGAQLIEEMEHFRMVSGVLAKLVGRKSAESQITARMAEVGEAVLPVPVSPLDHLMAQFLSDRAGRIHMESVLVHPLRAYARVSERILNQEREHTDSAALLLRDAVVAGTVDPSALQAAYARHIRSSEWCLGTPGSIGDALAVTLGLKSRPARENLQIFWDEVQLPLTSMGVQPRRLPMDPP